MKAIIDKTEEIKSYLEDLQFEEEYRDNSPENLQNGERYEQTGEICDSLSDAVSSIEDAIK